MSEAQNDPWAPKTAIPKLSMPGDLDPRKLNISSEEYIATLEAKLQKLQGKSGSGRKSKDMLKSLGDARENHMQGFLSNDSNPFSSTQFDEEVDAPQLSAIQKKLHPERQALTQEELKVLVDHDDLAKRVSALLDVDKENLEEEPFPFNEYKKEETDNRASHQKQNTTESVTDPKEDKFEENRDT